MLEILFSSVARIKLLKILLLESDGRFYVRELAARADLPIASVHQELANLLRAGVVIKERSGRQVYYSIDKRCPIIPELRSIFIKTVGVADVIKEALAPESKSIRCAFIFGSYATGDITSESDLDLLVIGDITLRRIVTALKPVQIGRELNPIVTSKQEFGARIASGDHFFTSLMNSAKIYLIGDDDELRKLAERG